MVNPLAHYASFLSRFQISHSAIAVSGGPDSMALAHMAHRHAQEQDGKVFFLTVDHGLRPDSAQEAQQVSDILTGLGIDKAHHHILAWEGEKPKSRVLEEARKARYDLLQKFCERQGINALFTAHHQDDQAETFLFRLAKGSGLDGLGAMRAAQMLSDTVTLYRPFLDLPKESLLQYCEENHIGFIQDPTNEKTEHYRPRMRQSKAILEGEGLTAARLSQTAKRLQRVRDAMTYYTDEAWTVCLTHHDDKSMIFNFKAFQELPAEIALRVLQKAIQSFQEPDSYGVRMQKLESLFEKLWLAPNAFKPQTLGGLVFALKDKNTALYISKEHA